MTLKNTLQG